MGLPKTAKAFMHWLTGLLAKPKRAKPTSVIEAVGGEQVVRKIAHDFYDIMENDAYASQLYEMHPKPLSNIRTLFADYLVMWMGGKDMYTPKRGHPRLRARHLAFEVTTDLKSQWMYCIRKALTININDRKTRDEIISALDALAEHMINK